MSRWDHIRHRRSVFRQEMHKLCFREIICLAAVSDVGDTKNVLLNTVTTDDKYPVPTAFMAGNRGKNAIFQVVKVFQLFKYFLQSDTSVYMLYCLDKSNFFIISVYRLRKLTHPVSSQNP